MTETPPFRFLAPEWLDVVDSTSTLLRERQPRPVSGSVVAAVSQTRGRGRLGNAWHSPPDTDLTFSYLWTGAVSHVGAGTLSLVSGLALADFLASIGLSPACKWPNDILLGDAKIAGVLCEAAIASSGLLEMVVGIGLNVRSHPGRQAAVGRPVACIEDATGAAWTPRKVLDALLVCLEKRINVWRREGFASQAGDYVALMAGIGNAARVRVGNRIVEGVVAGIDMSGGVCVETPDGGNVTITSVAALEDWGE